jgi:hypothetical protein
VLKSHVYLGRMAIGYLPHHPLETIAEAVGHRLHCHLHDLATHHWLPKNAGSSPLLMALERYNDGSEGSFVVDTSSQNEIALFKADFEAELEIMRAQYQSVEVIFGVCSHR